MQNIRKHKNFKKVNIFLLIVSILFFAVACNNNGLKIGFSRSGRYPTIFCAVKSDKMQFSLDDVSLDFYFGSSNYSKVEGLVYEPTCVAVYFRNSKYLDGAILQSMNIKDYKDIKGFYFIKEISFYQYSSGNYNVETPRFSDIKFTHSETLTVPKEVINLSEGYFSFVVSDVYFSEEDNFYIFQTAGYVDIKYKLTKATTINLFKP